jgi:hypothetical protein
MRGRNAASDFLSQPVSKSGSKESADGAAVKAMLSVKLESEMHLTSVPAQIVL